MSRERSRERDEHRKVQIEDRNKQEFASAEVHYFTGRGPRPRNASPISGGHNRRKTDLKLDKASPLIKAIRRAIEEAD